MESLQELRGRMPDLQQRMEKELLGNILPFWMQHVLDHENGGFYGAVHRDLTIDNTVERSLVLCARMLWTFSAVYRLYGAAQYLAVARHAYAALTGSFLDLQYGGFFWWVDAQGQPINARKQTYGQAFAVYALSEMHRATGEPEPLRLAQETFRLIETHASDPIHGGYIEGCARDWSELEDLRLSTKEAFNAPKSMNTLLHVLEAYSNLLRVWEDSTLRQRLRNLVEHFLDHVINKQTGFNNLFFSMDWTPQGEAISYGHDIEASWLLDEAAELLGDTELTARIQTAALRMADAVLAHGMDRDGSIFYEGDPRGLTNDQKHWWVHAEGVVGFYNAYQQSAPQDPARAERFIAAALRLWAYIEDRFVDREYGEWHKVLDRSGAPIAHCKSGPWEDPYHHSRACMEIIARA